MASEFIELLRPQTFIGRIEGFRRVPFNIRIPRQTAGSTVGWVGEGLSKPVSKLAFDSVTFPWAKVAGIVVITEELARFSSPAAEGLVRQDLIDTIAQFLDKWFVSDNPPVAGVSPGGIFNGVVAIPVGAAGVITVADITNALGAAISAMTQAGVPMRAPYWLMHTATAAKLGLLRTAQDVFAFKDEMKDGKLLGVPFLASPNMPVVDVVAPDPDTVSIGLIDASEILLADDGPVTIDVSREATLQLDSAPATPPAGGVSLWQQNMLGIKAEIYRYWMRRRDAAVQKIGPVVL
jgi:HK97 family phage major capsid protein